jgi:hypothetical protein
MILAWLKETRGAWYAQFRAAETPERMPASRLFQDAAEARAWVEAEAGKLKTAVQWL